MAAPLMFAAGMAATIVSVVLGVALIALSLRRGLIRERYGNWGRLFVLVGNRHARMRAGGTFDDGVMRLKFLSLRCRGTCHGA